MTKSRMTVGQALVKFLDNQYVSFDNQVSKFVDGIFTIFGHGIVCGLGQALDENPGSLKVYQGRNEQGMCHAAAGFAKQNNRRKIIACASSIGPGAANMVTAVADATVNHIPLLVFTGDAFATRQPDPVLQQLEQPYDLSVTTSDAFRPITRYWDRVSRPEQLMSAMIGAMRVLTDASQTGCVCISLPQDVQGEVFDFPAEFFQKRVHRIARPAPEADEIKEGIELICAKKKPVVICGGGVRYSEAGEALRVMCRKFNLPILETQAGKSAIPSSEPLNVGGVGVTGNLAANALAEQADLVIGVGTRYSDFTTGSKELFRNPSVSVLSVNISRFHAYKLDARQIVGDAKASIELLTKGLEEKGYQSGYQNEIAKAREAWKMEMDNLRNIGYGADFSPLIAAKGEHAIEDYVRTTGGTIIQTAAIASIREHIEENAIIVGASGSLPGDLQRMWTTDEKDTYLMEYGYSCMGYEIAAALGAKLARPGQPVYSMVGDGAFLMLHSELVTSLQERQKITILLFDNCGFGCINNLQMGNGMGSLATEFRFRNPQTGSQDGELIPIDYAMVGRGYGLKTYTAKNMQELETALEDAKKQEPSVLIDIKALPKTMTDSYKSWWHVGIAGQSQNPAVEQAYRRRMEHLDNARMY